MIESTTTAETLGSVIRTLRISQKLTLAQLAKQCDISVSYLSEIERNEANPTIEMLARIAFALRYQITFRLFSIDKRE